MNIKAITTAAAVASVLLLGGCGSSPESQINSAIEQIDQKFPELHCHWSEVDEFAEGMFTSSCETEDLTITAFKDSDHMDEFYDKVDSQFSEEGKVAGAVSVGDTLSYSSMDLELIVQVDNEVHGKQIVLGDDDE